MARRQCKTCFSPLVHAPTGRRKTYCSDQCRWRDWYRRSRHVRTYRDAWWTPTEVRGLVLSRHYVGLDAAACQTSRLVPRYLGPDHPDPAYRDALAYPDGWAELCPEGWIYLCPPYVPVNYLERFLELAVRTARAGTPVCALLPASVGVKWFTKHVLHAGGTPELLEERLVYGGPHSSGKPAPWGSTLVTWQF